MQIAIIRRKVGHALKRSEDVLTSAVFGLMRYLPPGVLWPTFFEGAQTPGEDGTLSDLLGDHGITWERYETVEIAFWKRIKRLEPDLQLTFSGPGQPQLKLIVEVKLRAKRGIRGRKDQIARYLRLLPRDSAKALHAFVYLTPAGNDYTDDFEEAFCRDPRLERLRPRGFHLTWTAIAQSVEREWKKTHSHPSDLIISDLHELLTEVFPKATGIQVPTGSPTSKPAHQDAGFVIHVLRL